MNQKIYLILNILKIPVKIRLIPVTSSPEHSLGFKNAYIQSHIQYLTENGKLYSQNSLKKKLNRSILIGKKDKDTIRNLTNHDFIRDSQVYNHFHRLAFNKIIIADKNSDSVNSKTDQNISKKTPYYNTVLTPAHLFFYEYGFPAYPQLQLNNDSINEDSFLSLKFVTSKINFFLIKQLTDPKSEIEIRIDFSEGISTPMSLQFFLHLPIIITSIIIVILILTFESDIDRSVIENEIAKLPLQKYTKNLEFKDCSICLDGFAEHDEVRILSCKHCFHKKCVDSWFLNILKCPLCRLADTPSYEIYQTIHSI